MSLGECSAGIDLYAKGAGGGAPAWSPSDLGGDLAGWWKSDVGVNTDVDGVYQWDDQSGNGKNWTQSTGSKKPQLVASAFGGGMDAVQGDALDDLLSVSILEAGTGPFTIFMARASGASSDLYMLGDANADGGYTTVTARALRFAGVVVTVSSTGLAVSTEAVEVFGRKTGGNLFWYHNGSDITNAGPPSSAGGWGMSVLFCRGTVNFANTSFGELFITLTDQSAAVDDASTYLNSRFGVY